MIKTAIVALTAAVLAAGAAAADAPAARHAKTCLFAGTIDGFTDAKRDSIVLTRGRDRWQAEVMGAFGLEHAETIAAVAHTACLSEGDTLKFREFGGSVQSAMITKLTYLGPKETKAH